ncbi:hypothetical protein GCM10010347_57690 [Streptomyces cirratus]|uniref:DUF4440 domain-containing protein n=1 Tax=Streptomyces cirratus TaxID=68187 RepID=A0ABQ3F416_9ACTN|nr:nuclear transport factor 2 family protein [Streptomyces cirratus]GHB79656.1 hypothetical protein GCM10010347_57690 [Streptomyces cirratus]
MSDERDAFLEWARTRLRDAESAVHNGDAGPRFALWSRREPVSVMGAWMSAVGYEQISELFHRLADSFSDCTAYAYEIVAADVVGDMAYTTGYERTRVSVNGEPRRYVLRVTQVYRREGGEWKVCHRHADTLETDQS